MIYTAKDVKAACNRIMRETFDCPIYEGDTLDGYQRPSFFAELALRGRSVDGAYISEQGYRYRITYFERTHDEAHCLDVYAKICRAFEPQIRLDNERRTRLPVESVTFAWIDEHADMLQVTVDFAMTREIKPPAHDGDRMETLAIRREIRGHYPERPQEP